VQLLQLVHGRSDVMLHSATTLDALESLATWGYVGREDASALSTSYAFLRTLEHRMQVHRLRRTHVIPDAPDDLRRIARRLDIRIAVSEVAASAAGERIGTALVAGTPKLAARKQWMVDHLQLRGAVVVEQVVGGDVRVVSEHEQGRNANRGGRGRFGGQRMGKTAIASRGIGKRFGWGWGDKHQDLRETIMSALRTPMKRLRKHNEDWTDGEDTFWALRDVNFDVRQGEIVGIIGRNGAGKSTLLKLLSRITEPTTGRIELRGRVASLSSEPRPGLTSDVVRRDQRFVPEPF